MKSEDPLDRLRQTCESLGIKQPPPTDNSLEREVILALRSALTIVRPGSLLDGAIRSTLNRCEQEWSGYDFRLGEMQIALRMLRRR